MKKANSPGNDTGGAAPGLTVKEIDEFLGLFRQLQTVLLSELPPKVKKLWEKCEEKAAQELSEATRRGGAQWLLRPSGSVKRRKTSGERKREEGMRERSISTCAGQLYREKDKEYAEALDSRDTKIKALMKEIDHLRYALGERVPAFLRFEDDESTSSWRRLRDSLSVGDVVAGFAGPVEWIIDALEAERGKVERQAAETGREIAHAEKERTKCQRICRVVKKVVGWICALVGFLAALLTILYYLGWL